MDTSYFQSFEQFNEQSMYSEDIKNKKIFINDAANIKQNLKNLKTKIEDLKSLIMNDVDTIHLQPAKKAGNKLVMFIEIGGEAGKIIVDFGKYVRTTNEKNRRKYCSLIFPDGDERSFSTEVQIEPDNFNRIHLRDGIPALLRGIGFGKNIYRAIIEKYGYISTNKFDRSLDAINVWDSLRKDKDIYSFISMEDRMLCIDDQMKYDDIVKILLEFFKFDIKERKAGKKMDTYVMDTDFRMKYYEEIEKTDLNYVLEKPYNMER